MTSIRIRPAPTPAAAVPERPLIRARCQRPRVRLTKLGPEERRFGGVLAQLFLSEATPAAPACVYERVRYATGYTEWYRHGAPAEHVC